MDDLLPHYERELAFLRGHAGEFAKAYPKIAGRLMLTGDVGEDPHVERLIESFALLAARVHKRLDDDFPLFTESFLEVLYPHYLRPFPSCAIARFDHAAAAQASRPGLLPRGTVLTSRPVRGVACRFRTACHTELLPLRVAAASFRGAIQAPAGTPLPRGATSLLSIQLELACSQASWASLQGSRLRLYLDGEASQAVVLREALLGRVVGSLVQTQAHGPWVGAQEALPQLVGFADDEALIEPDARTHPAYRLLTEYFGFPDKFNFVDITLPAAAAGSAGRSITLHYPLAGVRGDSDEARLLDTVSERNLLTGCAPVVNLFKQRAEPIRVTHAAEAYPVLPDARRAFAYEVYAVERVWRLQQSAHGEQVVEFKPFYSLQHDELLAEGEDRGRYWATRRDEVVAAASPGYETELSIVDVDFDPALPVTETLSVEVLATNRDLPAMLAAGGAGGDLFLEGGSLVQGIRLLRKPTQPQRFERGRGALWRLVSHLSVNHLSLAEGGLDALKELLRLYDLPRSAVNRRLLDGLVAIDFRRTSAWLPGEPFPAFVRGIEVRLSIDEAHFVGAGLRLFAQVMDHFFGLYVHLNSFVQLKILSSRTQEELIACPPRSGQSPLL